MFLVIIIRCLNFKKVVGQKIKNYLNILCNKYVKWSSGDCRINPILEHKHTHPFDIKVYSSIRIPI